MRHFNDDSLNDFNDDSLNEVRHISLLSESNVSLNETLLSETCLMHKWDIIKLKWDMTMMWGHLHDFQIT